MPETKMQLEDWLDDLCVRFIMNALVSDTQSLPRVCFAIEEAHWYYEDFIRPLDPELSSMTLRGFCEAMFRHCPSLADLKVDGKRVDGKEAYNTFLLYKSRIPVRGAILLNHAMDSVLLVKGWKKNANWSFPRGKINNNEDDLDCAIREVAEETGFDLEEAGFIPKDRNVHHIDITNASNELRLFVFRDIPMDTYFEPRTRKEISKIDWWRLSDLPAFRKKNKQDQSQNNIKPNQFFMVAPFLVQLRQWVVEQKRLDSHRARAHIPQDLVDTSQDDFLTDEDPGAESQGPNFTDADVSEFDHEQVLDSTATINRLFKLQQRPEDFLAAAPTPPPPPPPHRTNTKNTGEALLALLHSNPGQPHQPSPRNAPMHTPLDQTFEHAPIPKNPHHQHSQPPPFTNMPPPPQYHQMGSTNEAFTSQQQQIHRAQQQQQNNWQTQAPPLPEPIRNQGPHPYQPQHLIHPQPLPPHVQRTVFTGGPAAPNLPPPTQQYPTSQFSAQIPAATSSSQYQGSQVVSETQKPLPPHPSSHAGALLNQFFSQPAPTNQTRDAQVPIANKSQKLSVSQLNSQAITLLNTFKSANDTNNEGPAPVMQNRPLPTFQPPPPHQSRRGQPQELPGDLSQPIPTVPLQQPRLIPEARGPQTMDPNIFTSKQPISENQRSSLLSLFKSPTTPNAVPLQPPGANALPISAMPSAVELSAVEPLSENAASTSALLNDRRVPAQEVKDAPISEMNPELNLPFRAREILTRPPGLNDEQPNQSRGYTKLSNKANGKKSATSSQLPEVPSAKKPFQPQILKRPQSGSPQIVEQSTPTQASYATFGLPPPQAIKSHPITHMPTLAKSNILQPQEQKQALLSMFGKSSPALSGSQPMTKLPSADRFAPLIPEGTAGSPSTRSRISSLATGDNSRRGSGSPLSPADKGFLLGYLQNVVKGA